MRGHPRSRSQTTSCRWATRWSSTIAGGAGRTDAHQHSVVPLPASVLTMRSAISRTWRRHSQLAGHEHALVAGRGIRSPRSSAAVRQRERISTSPAARKHRQHSHRHRVARVGALRTSSASANVVIIGVGNTAMDCCRTSAALAAPTQGHRPPVAKYSRRPGN